MVEAIKHRMKFRKKHSSLKKRIRRGMFLNTFITVLIFSMAILFVVITSLSVFGQYIAYVKSTELSEFIASEAFLEYAEIHDLKQMIRPKFDRSYLQYVFETTDAIVLIKPEENIPLFQGPDPEEMESTLPPPPNGLTVLQFQMKLGQNIVYTTPEFNDQSIFTFLDTYAEVPFINALGEEGVIQGKVTPKLLEFIFILISFLVIMLSIVATLVSVLVSALLSRKLVMPLRLLIGKMNQIAEADLIDVVQTEITVAKPVQEIVELTDATNAIFLKMRDFSMQLEAQNEELTAQNDELEAATDELERLNADIFLYNTRLSNILDNSGQGFLAFGKSLKIGAVYSKECLDIFGRDIAGEQLSELLYEVPEHRSFLERLYKRIFEMADPKLYMELLPTDWVKGDFHYHIEHREILLTENERGLMAIFTDVTQKIALEKTMHQEQCNLKKVVKVVRYQQEFKSLYEEIKAYQYDVLRAIQMEGTIDQAEMTELYRHLHNFKGLLSQYDFNNSVDALNGLEDAIAVCLGQADFDEEVAFNVIKDLTLTRLLSEDLSVIDEMLGSNVYQSGRELIVEASKLEALEAQLKQVMSQNALARIMPYVQDLKDRHLSRLFRSYPEYAEKLADRLEKSVDMKVVGEDIICDVHQYDALSKAMIHLLRNAVDHGIERPEERKAIGKPERGSIELTLKRHEDQVEMTLSDDGQGISVDTIKAHLIDQGILEEAAVEALDDQAAIDYIFNEQFTTREESTEFSGRGMGLSSVKHEVELLGGRIEVQTTEGEGSRFVIRVPLLCESYDGTIQYEAFENAILNKTEQLISGFSGKAFTSTAVTETDKFELHAYTALISTKGVMNSLVVLSLPEDLVLAVGSGYLGTDDPLTQEECEDLVLELSNIALGNSLEALGMAGDQVHIGTPTLVCYKGATVRYAEAELKAFVIETDTFSAHLGILYQ